MGCIGAQESGYERLGLIGRGTLGEVYRCKGGEKEYALRVVKYSGRGQSEVGGLISNLRSEMGILSKLSHPNIVKYETFNLNAKAEQIEILMELVPEGSLKQLIERKGNFEEKAAAEMTRMILEGLQYLHHQGIVHRDLKPGNILCNGSGTVKIADYCSAKYLYFSRQENGPEQDTSAQYMAPEILKRVGHAYSADIWSLGCCVIEMLTGKSPWNSIPDKTEMLGYIRAGVHPPFPVRISKDCQAFLLACLDALPGHRLTAQQLLYHKWLFHSKTPVDDLSLNLDPLSENPAQKLAPTANLNHPLPERVHLRESPKPHQDNRQRYPTDPSNFSSLSVPLQTSPTVPTITQIEDQEIGLEIGKFYLKKPRRSKRSQLHPPNKTSQTIKFSEKELGEDIDFRTRLRTEGSYDTVNRFNEINEEDPMIENQLARPREDTNNSYESTRRPSRKEAGIIDTIVSRAERNRYFQEKQREKQQREEERKKWEQELQEGSSFLKKEFSARYYFTNH